MRQGLRKFAKLTILFARQFLSPQTDIIGPPQQPFEKGPGLVLPPLCVQCIGQPKAGRHECALSLLQPVVGILAAIAPDEAAANQLALYRRDGSDHALVAGIDQADKKQPQHGGIESVIVIGPNETVAPPIESLFQHLFAHIRGQSSIAFGEIGIAVAQPCGGPVEGDPAQGLGIGMVMRRPRLSQMSASGCCQMPSTFAASMRISVSVSCR